MEKSSITIGLAQLKCELLNKEINLKRMLSTVKEAEEKGADYLIFPELFLSGYVMDDQLFDIAETIDGESIKKLQEAAFSSSVGILAGFPEKKNKKLYNSAVFINKKGSIEDVYRKTHLFRNEAVYFSPGSKADIIKLPEGKAGVLITFDMEFPEMPRLLASQGAEVIFVLAANMSPYQRYQHIYLHSRAMENHVFMAAANKVGLHVDNIFFGESQVVSPEGISLYKAGHNEELGIVEINLNETKTARGELNYLQNKREDLY